MSKLRALCMPKWGIEMTEGTLAEWKQAEGVAFKKGDLICLIETDKITNEVEAERDGIVHRIVIEAGGEPEPVGALLAVLGEDQADSADIDNFIADFVPSAALGSATKKRPQAQQVADEQPVPPEDAISADKGRTKIDTNRPISPQALDLAEREHVDLAGITGSGRNGRISLQDVEQALRPPRAQAYRGVVDHPPEDRSTFASPLARRLAALNDIDLSAIEGSGRRGRISKADVLAKVKAPASRSETFGLVTNEPSIEPFDKIRKVVARRLGEAKREIPHFYLRISVKADVLIELRRTANLVLGSKISLNDFLVMAAAKALVRHPEINVQLHGEELHRFAHADIAVAVASPKGLLTPIVRQADRMRIEQIAAATRALIDKANEGRLGYDDMDGGTFTISNLGMFGIADFDAIINPPQAAILAVGTTERRLAEMANGEIAFETQIALTLSVDHRAIDGAAAAQFLATLKAIVEQPEQLFA